MIPEEALDVWKSSAPWVTNEQVEQDLVLSRAIIEIFSDPMIQSALYFRGGTALHKLFLNPAGRYSEDIDLVQVAPGPIGPVTAAIKARLDSWLGRSTFEGKEKSAKLIYKFQSEIPQSARLRLKLEINTRERLNLYGTVRAKFSVKNPWFTSQAEVVTYTIEEILGTKLRALYNRKKGRDLFDMATSLRRLPKLDIDKVLHCFTEYSLVNSQRVSRAEFEKNMKLKLLDLKFLQDLLPLLPRGTKYELADAEQDWADVHSAYVEKLPGDPWKGFKEEE